MGLFWFVVVLVGLIGGPADVSLDRWSKTLSGCHWVMSLALYALFMTGFGLAMRIGNARGYSLTVIVLVVLLSNIVAVGLWDFFFRGSHLSALQWLGMTVAMVAVACLELGKE